LVRPTQVFSINTVFFFFGKRGQEDSLVEAVLKENTGVIYITGHSLEGAMTHLGALGIISGIGMACKI